MRVLYRQRCQRCHEADGTGGGHAPDFADGRWQRGRTDAQLLVSILDGKGDGMPGFRGKISDAQARELVALVRAFAGNGAAMTVEFSARFRQLQQELEELQKQFRELSDPARRAQPQSRRGSAYLYAFDVANEIRLDRAAGLLAAAPARFAAWPGRPARESMPTARPLEVEAAPPAAGLGGRPVRLLVRVYDVGVVSVVARAGFEAGALPDLAPLHRPTLDDGRPLDALARQLCAETCRGLAGALVRPGPVGDPEAYTAFCLTDLGGEGDANRWLAARRRAVAGLLADADPGRLSDAQVDEGLRLRRSFENTDLVVIDWDAALVADLTGPPEDALLVLELANLQLEEFRWLDRTLDRYLDRAYAELGRPRWPLGTGAGAALRALRRLRIDLAKLADEATHVTKFVGDWHLARVHLLARERFHLDQWRASVEQRLGQLDQLYTLAHDELYERRMLWLEVAIVVLFVVDLIALLARPTAGRGGTAHHPENRDRPRGSSRVGGEGPGRTLEVGEEPLAERDPLGEYVSEFAGGQVGTRRLPPEVRQVGVEDPPEGPGLVGTERQVHRLSSGSVPVARHALGLLGPGRVTVSRVRSSDFTASKRSANGLTGEPIALRARSDRPPTPPPRCSGCNAGPGGVRIGPPPVTAPHTRGHRPTAGGPQPPRDHRPNPGSARRRAAA